MTQHSQEHELCLPLLVPEIPHLSLVLMTAEKLGPVPRSVDAETPAQVVGGGLQLVLVDWDPDMKKMEEAHDLSGAQGV